MCHELLEPAAVLFLHQLLERAQLSHPASLQNSDQISVLNSGQPVGNYDHRPLLHDLLQRLLHQVFRGRVQCGRRLVQQ